MIEKVKKPFDEIQTAFSLFHIFAFLLCYLSFI